jgi:hypothetical protein
MSRLKFTFLGGIVVALVAVCFPGAGPAQGGIIVTKSTVQEIADPTFLYTFTVEIDDECVLQPGNFFTIFDLFSPPDTLDLPDNPPTAPPGWVASTPALGPSPFGPSIYDTSILNVAWTYFGPVMVGPLFVGEFTVTIEQPAAKLPEVVFVSECGPLGSGTPEMGFVGVQVIPEPATMGMMACGGIGLLMARKRQGRRRAAVA